MTTAQDTVSVIIPVYNEEKNLEAFISSLVQQTYPIEKMEWIFVDGKSSDGTVSIIKRYMNEYPIVLLQNEDRVTPKSLNIGIQNAKGSYIVRMDAHTIFPADYIETCIHYLQKEQADNVGGRIEAVGRGLFGETFAALISSRFGVGNSSFRVDDKGGYVDTVPFGAFRSELFQELGLFNETLLRSEDNEFNSRIIKNGGKVYLIGNLVSKYICRDSLPAIIRMALLNGNALFRTLIVDKSAMRLRHFIPFLFLLFSLSGVLSVAFNWKWKWLFAFVMSIYLLLDVVASFKSELPILKMLLLLLLFPVFHLCYGFGSLLGLLGVKLY